MPDLLTGARVIKRRLYKDRLGRLITDPRQIEVRFVQEKLRRMYSRGLKANRPWYALVTAGEPAKATGKSPQEVVRIVREFYLGPATETDGPIEEWGLGEDGE